jgi:hypothetical protein
LGFVFYFRHAIARYVVGQPARFALVNLAGPGKNTILRERLRQPQ